ncbi:MAG: hypothetical protein WCP85_22225 [Mariniphaga sp.]
MSTPSGKFLLKISVFTILVIAISATLFMTILKAYYFNAFIIQVILISAVTAIGHLLVAKAVKKNIRKFATAYMASVTLKLVVYLIYLLVSLLIDHSQVIQFAITFLVLYLVYTIFEVVEVLRFLKKQSIIIS